MAAPAVPSDCISPAASNNEGNGLFGVLADMPEPASMAVFGLGLAAVRGVWRAAPSLVAPRVVADADGGGAADLP